MRILCGTILAAVVGLSLAAEVLKTVDGKVTRESCTANALKADSSPLGSLNRF